MLLIAWDHLRPVLPLLIGGALLQLSAVGVAGDRDQRTLTWLIAAHARLVTVTAATRCREPRRQALVAALHTRARTQLATLVAAHQDGTGSVGDASALLTGLGADPAGPLPAVADPDQAALARLLRQYEQALVVARLVGQQVVQPGLQRVVAGVITANQHALAHLRVLCDAAPGTPAGDRRSAP